MTVKREGPCSSSVFLPNYNNSSLLLIRLLKDTHKSKNKLTAHSHSLS